MSAPPLLAFTLGVLVLPQDPLFENLDRRAPIVLSNAPEMQAGEAQGPLGEIHLDDDGIRDAWCIRRGTLYLVPCVGHWSSAVALRRGAVPIAVHDAARLVGAGGDRDALVTAGPDGLCAWLWDDDQPGHCFELPLCMPGSVTWSEATRVVAGPHPLAIAGDAWSQLAVWDASTGLLFSFLLRHDLAPGQAPVRASLGWRGLEQAPVDLCLSEYDSSPPFELARAGVSGLRVERVVDGELLLDVPPLGATRALAASVFPLGPRIFWVEHGPAIGQSLRVLGPGMEDPVPLSLPWTAVVDATAAILGGSSEPDVLLGHDPAGRALAVLDAGGGGAGQLVPLDLGPTPMLIGSSRKALIDVDHDGRLDLLSVADETGRLYVARNGSSASTLPGPIAVDVTGDYGATLTGEFVLPLAIDASYAGYATHAEVLLWRWLDLDGPIESEPVTRIVVDLADHPYGGEGPWIVQAQGGTQGWNSHKLFALELRLARIEDDGTRRHLGATCYGYALCPDDFQELRDRYPDAWYDQSFDGSECNGPGTGASFVGGIIVMPSLPPYSDDLPVLPDLP